MADEPDPPRKFYDFKPKEFENVNRVPPPPQEGAPPPPPNPTPAGDGGRIDVKDLFQQAKMGGGPLLSPRDRPTGPRNEVHAMLDENLARANAAGLNDLAPKPERVSRRKRHYWAAMSIGTAVFGAMAAVNGWQFFARKISDPLTAILFVTGVAGLVIFNLGLWWIMWHIMEDY